MISKKPRAPRATKAEMLRRAKEKLAKAGQLPSQSEPSPSPSPAPSSVSTVSPVSDSPITPLPLFDTPAASSAPVPTVDPSLDPEKDKMLKEGLAEIVSEDIPRFLQNGLILAGWDKRASVNPPSRGRAALWAEFALPMLRKYFPNFDAEIMFWVLTASLFGSMIEIKKPEGQNAETKTKS